MALRDEHPVGRQKVGGEAATRCLLNGSEALVTSEAFDRDLVKRALATGGRSVGGSMSCTDGLERGVARCDGVFRSRGVTDRLTPDRNSRAT